MAKQARLDPTTRSCGDGSRSGSDEPRSRRGTADRAGGARGVPPQTDEEVTSGDGLDRSQIHLVHLCRWTATLIADKHGVYDPTSTADRMVLGIRGQVSELERDSSVHRREPRGRDGRFCRDWCAAGSAADA